MPKKKIHGKCSVRTSTKVRTIICRFCQKSLLEKEVELHFYVCEKVPQEIFSQSLQDTLGW